MMSITKEERMSKGLKGRRLATVVGLLAVAAAATAVLAAGAAGARNASKACGTVTLNEQAWAGSTANTYVAKNVLEKYSGCKVNITQIAEIPVYQAMADGKTDAVLEDWQHVAQYKQYVNKQHTVVCGGPNGVTGAHRLVHPDVPDEAASRVQDVEGPEGQGVALQEPGVRLAGDVPRRRPVLRAEGPAADPGARAELQVRQRRRRARAGRALEPAVQAAQAGHLLLVRRRST